MGHEPDDDTNFEGIESLCRLSGFVRLLCCGRLPASGLCLSLRAGSTLAHKLVKSRFVCQPGAASQLRGGQRWHTNRLFQVLCASRALPLTCAEVNVGTQIGQIGICVPVRRCLLARLRSMLAHKSVYLRFVCHAGAVFRTSKGKK